MVDLHRDFDIFLRKLISSNDVDPIYPFIASTLKCFDFEPEWFCLVYTTFYSLESAIILCNEMNSAEQYNPKKFLEMRSSGILNKFGHERRGNQRGINNQNLMLSIISKELLHIKKQSTKLDQQEFRNFISRTIPFHGLWSTFKIAEVFEKSLGCENLKIDDLGIVGKDVNSNDGPVGGLRWLYGRENIYTKDWYRIWDEFGRNLSNEYNVDIGEVESTLCKFHKIVSGNYFIGHDIMELIELKHVYGNNWTKCMQENFSPLFWKNIKTFPKHYKKVYKETGDILYSNIHSILNKVDILEQTIKTLN
jgi:DNA-binding ferritin-like protein (Dps family)